MKMLDHPNIGELIVGLLSQLPVSVCRKNEFVDKEHSLYSEAIPSHRYRKDIVFGYGVCEWRRSV